MPNRTNAATIDLDFRPRSYWEHSDPTSAILQNIKGQVRREMVRDFIAGTAPARLGPIEPELLEDEVNDHTRAFLGRIHPRWMGGEYLPGYRRGEVEIARVALNSTTGDVISFRVRRAGPTSPLRYRVVDEYATEYKVTRRTSRRPLTLRQLIRFIDQTDGGGCDGDGLSFVERLITYGADGDVNFASVESEVYPWLQQYYEERLAKWGAARNKPQWDDEEEEEQEQEEEREEERREAAAFAKELSAESAPSSSSATHSPPRDLVELVMQRHGFTRAQAIQALEDLGA